MNIMLCVPTHIVELDKHTYGEKQVMSRQQHLEAFKDMVSQWKASRHSVYCFLDLYEWRRGNFASEADAVARDWQEVQKAEHVVACPVVHGVSSKGVHIEIGWATALRRPVTILMETPEANHANLLMGFKGHPDFDVDLLYYRSDPLTVWDDLSRRLNGRRGPSKALRFLGPQL